MARRKAKFADFEDPEFLGNLAQEAGEYLKPEIAVIGEHLRAALGTGPEWETFLRYEELVLEELNAIQQLTVERLLSALGRRQATA